MIRTAAFAGILALSGCVTSEPTGATLPNAPGQMSIVDMLGARAVARELAAHCNGVDLAAGLEDQVDALRVSRADEFDAVTSGRVIQSALGVSTAFQQTYGVSIDLVRTARKDWDNSMCPGARTESRRTTALGLMLDPAR